MKNLLAGLLAVTAIALSSAPAQARDFGFEDSVVNLVFTEGAVLSGYPLPAVNNPGGGEVSYTLTRTNGAWPTATWLQLADPTRGVLSGTVTDPGFERLLHYTATSGGDSDTLLIEIVVVQPTQFRSPFAVGEQTLSAGAPANIALPQVSGDSELYFMNERFGRLTTVAWTRQVHHDLVLTLPTAIGGTPRDTSGGQCAYRYEITPSLNWYSLAAPDCSTVELRVPSLLTNTGDLPARGGNFTFTLRATDGADQTADLGVILKLLPNTEIFAFARRGDTSPIDFTFEIGRGFGENFPGVYPYFGTGAESRLNYQFSFPNGKPTWLNLAIRDPSDRYPGLLTGRPDAGWLRTKMYFTARQGGQSAVLTFTVGVSTLGSPPLTFDPASVADQSYAIDDAISTLILPKVRGGIEPYTHTLTGAPSGLTFKFRKTNFKDVTWLVGTPEAGTRGDYSLTYTVADSFPGYPNFAHLVFNVNVAPIPLVFTPSSVGELSYTAGTPIILRDFPVVSRGTGTYTVSLDGAPDGLSFTRRAATGGLHGTPTVGTEGDYSLTYTVTDEAPNTASLTFGMHVSPPGSCIATTGSGFVLTSTPLPRDLVWTVGASITPTHLTPGFHRSGIVADPTRRGTPYYELLDAPAGIMLIGNNASDPNPRLVGTPSTASAGTHTMRYRIRDDHSCIEKLITVEVRRVALFDSDEAAAYRGTELTYIREPGGVKTLTLPLLSSANNSGKPPFAYTVSPAASTGLSSLPSWLDFRRSFSRDRRNGVSLLYIRLDTVTTAGGAEEGPYVYTGVDSNGRGPAGLSFHIRVVPPPLVFNPASQSNRSYVVGTDIGRLNLPAASGGTPGYTFTLDGEPNGLNFNGATNPARLSGTPAADSAGLYDLTFKVRDSDGTEASLTFAVSVLPGAGMAIDFADNARTDYTFTEGVVLTNFPLPIPIDNTGEVTYTLTRADGSRPSQSWLRLSNSSRGVLNGSVTQPAIADRTLHYTATDDFDSATLTFALTVRRATIFNPDEAAEYRDVELTFNRKPGEVETLTLPHLLPETQSDIYGGTPPFTYTLRPAASTGLSSLPSRLSFSTITYTDRLGAINNAGELLISLDSVTTAGAAEEGPYVYTGADFFGAGPGSLNFRIRVVPSPPVFNPASQPNRNYVVGTDIDMLSLPTVSGGTPEYTFTLDGEPNGLNFNGATNPATLSGTPAPGSTGAYDLTFKARDADGTEASLTFAVNVLSGTDIVIGFANNARTDYTFTNGVVLTNFRLPAAINNTGEVSYTLTRVDGTRPLQPWLSLFDSSRGALNGTVMPPAVVDRTLHYTATDDLQSATLTFALTVRMVAAYNPGEAAVYRDTELTFIRKPGGVTRLTLPLLSETTGTPPFAYTMRPAASTGLLSLPSWFRFVHSSFKGKSAFFLDIHLDTATTAGGAEEGPFVYTGVDSFGVGPGGLSFRIRVIPTLVFNPASQPNRSYVDGTDIGTLTLPAASGGTPEYTFALDGEPNGLSLNGATNPATLSGTPAAGSAGSYDLRFKVRDADGTEVSLTFNVNIAPPLRFTSASPDDFTYTAGVDIGSRNLPAVSGGAGNYTLSLAGAPSGLNFNGSTNPAKLSGTPADNAAGEYSLTFSVTDEASVTASLTFGMHVAALGSCVRGASKLVFEESFDPFPEPGELEWLKGTPIVQVALPIESFDSGKEAVVANPARSGFAYYELLDAPTGIVLINTDDDDLGDVAISGTPQSAGDYNMRYRIHDDLGCIERVIPALVIDGPGLFRFPASAVTDYAFTTGAVLTDFQLPTPINAGGAEVSYTLTRTYGEPTPVVWLQLADPLNNVLNGTVTGLVHEADNTLVYTARLGGHTAEIPLHVHTHPRTNFVPLDVFNYQNAELTYYQRAGATKVLTLPRITRHTGLAPFTFALTPAASTGLSALPASFSFSGINGRAGLLRINLDSVTTPGAAEEGPYIYTAVDSFGVSDNNPARISFHIRVVPELPVFDEAAKDLVLSVADAPINYTLPAIVSGANPSDVTYDAGGSLGSLGLSVADGERVIISGASPTASADSVDITVTATNTTTGHTGQQVVSVRITNPPVLPAENPSPGGIGRQSRYTYYLFNRQAMNLTLPAATAGTGNALDTLATPLDCGSAVPRNVGDQRDFNDLVMTVAADGVSCILTGMYPRAGSGSSSRNLDMVYTVTDAAGQTDTKTVKLRGTASSAIGGNEVNLVSDLTFTMDQAISSAGTGTNRGPYVRFPRSQSIPRENLHRLGPDADGTGNLGIPGLTFTVGVFQGNFRPDASESFRLRGTPTATGTHELTYHYTLEADNGGRVDNGQVTNTDYGLSQTKYDFTGQTLVERAFPVRITIATAPDFSASGRANPPTLSYTKNFDQGTVSLTMMPEVKADTGTPPYKYSIGANADLAGLVFTVPNANVRTLRIRGTPTGAPGSYPLVWTVTDAQGAAATLTFQVVIAPELVFAETLPVDHEYLFPTGVAHTEILPAVTGGQEGLTFSVAQDSTTPADQLSAKGITHKPAQGEISGTATGGALARTDGGGFLSTYTVRDANGAQVVFTFSMSIREAVTFTTDSVERTYTAGRVIADFTFPTAGGAEGTFTYDYIYEPSEVHLTTNLGLRLDTTDNTNPATLSGAPTQHADAAVIKMIPTSVVGLNNATYTATILVAGPLVFSGAAGVGALTYGAGAPIPPLTLPETPGGIGTLTRTLTDGDTTDGDLPAGFVFDADAGILSGAPSAAATGLMFTYTVVDEPNSDGNSGEVSLTFDVSITGPPSFAPDAAIADMTFVARTPITSVELPVGISGGAVITTYTLHGPPGGQILPAGLRFDDTARTLSGTPTQGADANFTYSVVDRNGASASLTFRLTVTAAIHFGDAMVPEMTYSSGVPITTLTLPPHIGFAALNKTLDARLLPGGSVDSCDPLCAGGLSFTAGETSIGSSSTLSGTPAVAGRYRFSHNANEVSADPGMSPVASPIQFHIVVVAAPMFTGPLATGIPDQAWSQNLAITPLTLPDAASALGLSFELTGDALTSFSTLTLDHATRVLSGTPDTIFGESPLTYTATDPNGAASTLTFQVQVRGAPQLATIANVTYAAGVEMPMLTLPDITDLATGVRPLTFELTDGNGNSDLEPFGLTYSFTPDNAAPGSSGASPPAVLSGTPTPVSGERNHALRYTVTDANGFSVGADFAYHVAPILAFDRSTTNVPEGEVYEPGPGEPIPSLTLPGATGGATPLVYTLTPDPLPNDLVWSGDSTTAGVLSGTLVTGSESYVFTVTDTNGNAVKLNFRISKRGPSFDGITQEDLTFEQGTRIGNVVLPEAGTTRARPNAASVRYSLADQNDNAVDDATNSVLPGLAFNSGTRTLSGTPTAGRNRAALTYTATDGNGNPERLIFNVLVRSNAPAFNRTNIVARLDYTETAPITPHVFPGASGGITPLTYEIRDQAAGTLALPSGLILAADPPVLIGRPARGSQTGGESVRVLLVRDSSSPTALTATLTFRINIRPAPTVGNPGDLTFTVGYPVEDQIASNLLLAAQDGKTPLSYSLSAGPPGVDVGADDRMLFGVPTTYGTFETTYRVHEANGATAFAVFQLVIDPPLEFDQSSANVLEGSNTVVNGVDALDPPLTLPIASSVRGSPTPVLMPDVSSDPIFTGLAFDPATRVLSGALTADGGELTWAATDDNGVVGRFKFSVSAIGPYFPDAQDDLTLTQGKAVDKTLPAANTRRAQGTTRYTLLIEDGRSIGAALPGLAFNANTRKLFGTPSAGKNPVVLVYAATDDGGNTFSLRFNVSVTPNTLAFAAGEVISNRTYTATADGGELVLPTAVVGTGIAPLTYSISSLPDGLTFNAGARPPIVTGTPTAAREVQITYTVFDSTAPTQMNASLSFLVIVAAAPVLTQDNLTFTAGYPVEDQIVDEMLAGVAGGLGPYTYAVDGQPAGLRFQGDTRRLLGAPTATTAQTHETTYGVTDRNGAVGSVIFTIRINAPLVFDEAGGNVAEGSNVRPEIDGSLPKDVLLPTVTGGVGTASYELMPDVATDPLFAGLAHNNNARTISGTLNGDGGELTWTATDDNGARKEFRFRINPEGPLFTGNFEDLSFDEGQRISTVQFDPANLSLVPSGASVFYALEGENGEAIGALLPGLAFNARNRRLTGTPRSGSNVVTLIYKAMDTAGNADTRSFTVRVTPRALSFGSASIADQSYTAGATIDTLNLPTASGGIADLAYALSGLPAGLTFDGDANPPTISGTPSGTADVQLVYTVTDASTVALTEALAFNVFVAAAPTLTQAALTLVKGFAVEKLPTPLTLPAAAVGIAPFDYAVDGLPDGLRFDGRSRAVTGVPTTEGTPNVSYRVTDANDAVGAVTFTVTVAAPITFAEVDGAAHVRDGVNYRVDPTSLALVDVALTLPTASGGSTGTVILELLGPEAAGPGEYGGLVFDGTNLISGSLTGQSPGGGFTWRATDSATGAYADLRFSITTEGPYFESDMANEFIFIRGVSAGVQLGAANIEQVSAGSVAYTLTGLPSGMAFNAGNRTLSGTPLALGDYRLTFAVTDPAGNSDSEEIALTVLRKLHFGGLADDVVWPAGVALNITLPDIRGGSAPLTFTLSGLPSGLLFNSGDPSTITGTPSTAGVHQLIHIAEDASGERIAQKLKLTVRAGPVFVEGVGVIGYMESEPDLLEVLPKAVSATPVNITYEMQHRGGADLPGSLVFNGNTRQLSGNPLEGERAERISTVLTYIATDTSIVTRSANTRAVQTHGVSRIFITLVAKRANVNRSPVFSANPRGGVFGIKLGPVDSYVTVDLTRYFHDPDDDDRLLAFSARSRNDDLVRVIGIDGGMIRLLLGSPDIGDTGTSTADLTVTATDPLQASTRGTLSITVVQRAAGNYDAAITSLNRVLLPNIARAIADGNINAIAGRIGRATAAAAYNLGGQSNLESIAATQARALADGNFDLKKLLTRSSFTVPFKAPAGSAPVKGAPERVLLEEGATTRLSLLPGLASNLNTEAAADQTRQGLSTLTLWGSGAYRNLSVDSTDDADPEWDGGIFSAHIGADLLLRPGLFGGLAVSWSNSEMEYRTQYDKGEHNLDMTTVSPYLSKTFYEGSLDVWGAVGLGRGELEITSENGGSATSDVSMRTLAAGASYLLVHTDQGLDMSLNGEMIRTALEMDGGGFVEPLDIDSTRLRVSVAVESTRALAGGALLNPNMEIGLRYDTGDGESALAVQLQAGMRYFGPDTGTTLEGKVHALLGGPEGYGERGIEGNFIFIPRAVRALSLTITPAYGVLPGGLDQIWRQDLSDLGGDTSSDKPAPTINARLSYAIKKSGAVLTPHTEFNFGEGKKAWRTGISLGRERFFDFDLTAERREEESEDPAHTILLKGKLDF